MNMCAQPPLILKLVLTISRQRYLPGHNNDDLTTHFGLVHLEVVSRVVPFEVPKSHASRRRVGGHPCGCQVCRYR